MKTFRFLLILLISQNNSTLLFTLSVVILFLVFLVLDASVQHEACDNDHADRPEYSTEYHAEYYFEHPFQYTSASLMFDAFAAFSATSLL